MLIRFHTKIIVAQLFLRLLYVFAWHQRCIANIHAAFQCWSFQLSPYGAVVACRTAK